VNYLKQDADDDESADILLEFLAKTVLGCFAIKILQNGIFEFEEEEYAGGDQKQKQNDFYRGDHFFAFPFLF